MLAEQTEEKQTPVSNTGVNTSKTGIEALIDWFQGTFPQSQLEKVRQLVASALESEFVDRQKGTTFYESSSVCSGAVLAWSPRLGGKVTDRTDAYLEMGAKVLQQLSPLRQYRLFKSLGSLGFRASRVDLTIDDYDKRFRPWDAYQVYRSGGVTGFRRSGSYHESDKKAGVSQSFSLGKRGKLGSGKYLVIYDKWLESDGARDCIRVELSLYGDYAKQAMESLLLDAELWSQLIPCYVFGSVNFLMVEAGKEARADRCERVSWWHEIVQDSPAIKLSRPVPVRTYDKAVKWFKKQVAPTLAMLLDVIAIDSIDNWWEFFWKSVEDGQKRWNENHIAMIRETEARTKAAMIG